MQLIVTVNRLSNRCNYEQNLGNYSMQNKLVRDRIAAWGRYVPVIILLIGVAIRIWGYTSSAIRYDEALSLFRATTPFSKFLEDHQYYSSLFLWELILRLIVFDNHSLWLLRLPSLVLGIGSLLLSFKLMWLMRFNPYQKTIAISLIAFSPGLIWVSQDARAYGLLIFLYLLAIYFVESNKPVGIIAIAGLTAYTHAIGPAFGISALLYYLVKFPKEYKRFIYMLAIVIASWIPWYWLFFSIQPTPGYVSTFWLGKITFAEFIQHLFKTFYLQNPTVTSFTLFMIAFTGILISLTYMVVKNKIKESMIFFLPMGVILIESIVWRNVFFYRTGLTLLIPFMLCIGMTTLRSRFNPREFLTILFCFFILVSSMVGWNPATKGGTIDQVAKYITQYWEEGDILYYGTATVGLPFHYYLPGKPEYIIDGITNENLTPPTVDIFESASLDRIQSKRAWLIYPDDIFIPAEQMKILTEHASRGNLLFRIKIFEIPDINVVLLEHE